MPYETINHIATIFPIDAEALKGVKYHRSGSIIKEFGLNTSTHGIPGIARSQSIPNRIFWSVCLLIFTGIMLYFVIESILAYFTYPTQTSITTVVEWPQLFPAVTICNYSPLRYDQFIGPFLNYTNSLNLTNTTDTTSFTRTQSYYVYDFLTYKLNLGESLDDFLYPLDAMLMSCTYNNLPCSATNFTWFMSASFGLCYTFNAKLKSDGGSSLHYNSDNGQNGLLNLGLYVHQHQYVPYLSKGIGMVTVVHDNIDLPFIELAAMYLAPGRHHKMSYMKKESSFLPAPYTTCNDKLNLGMQLLYDQYEDTDYGFSQFQCYLSCIQTYTYYKCKCGNPFRWQGRSIVLPGSNQPINISFCAVEDPCYMSAGSELMNTATIWTTYCPDCTQECSYSEFMIKATSLLAPPAYLLNDIKAFVESSTIPVSQNWSSSWASDIQTNYVSLEVAYETTRTDVYSQQATLGPVDVISNVGGQTGLWIGISFLSLMEIAEMIYRLIRSQGYNLIKRIKRKIAERNTRL